MPHTRRTGDPSAASVRWNPSLFWFNKSCGGIFAMIVVNMLIVFPCIFIPYRMTANWDIPARILGSLLIILFGVIAGMSHFRCATTDPGATALRTLKETYPKAGDYLLSEVEGMRFCVPCNNPKPPKAHHCSSCDRCIYKMDHHCPWMNNCVGMNNFKFFILFLVFVSFMCITSLGSVVATLAISCPVQLNKEEPTNWSTGEVLELFVTSYEDTETRRRLLASPSIRGSRLREKVRSSRSNRKVSTLDNGLCGFTVLDLVGTIALSLESLLFGIFTIVMGCDSFCHAVDNDGGVAGLGRGNKSVHRTVIAKLKQSQPDRTTADGIREMLGGPLLSFWSWTPFRRPKDHFVRGNLTELDLFLLSERWLKSYCNFPSPPGRESIISSYSGYSGFYSGTYTGVELRGKEGSTYPV